MQRGFEREELSAYLGADTGKTWEKYMVTFEHLCNDQGNLRFAFSWFWMALLCGPFFLVYRKSYVAAALGIGSCFILATFNAAAFWGPWLLTPVLAGPIMLRRFLKIVRESKVLEDRSQRLDFIRKHGGPSPLVELLTIFG